MKKTEEEYHKEHYNSFTRAEYLDKQERAFNALFFYEINCIEKYDVPGKPSKLPPKGERMEDFAMKYGTTVEKMKKMWPQVEFRLKELGIWETENQRS